MSNNNHASTAPSLQISFRVDRHTLQIPGSVVVTTHINTDTNIQNPRVTHGEMLHTSSDYTWSSSLTL